MILLDIMNKPDEQKRGINIHPYVLIHRNKLTPMWRYRLEAE